MIEFTGEKLEEQTHKLLKKVTKKALKMLGQKPRILDLCVNFVYDNEMREINNRMRNINEATDVLSFPMLDYPKDKVFKDVYKNVKFNEIYLDGEELVLGDMVLSLERAREQSIEYNHSFNREVCYLVVHSILHLLGYDHMENEEKKKMRQREEEILGNLKLSNNFFISINSPPHINYLVIFKSPKISSSLCLIFFFSSSSI